MKRYDETIVTQYFKRETRRLTHVVCDICGKEIKAGKGYRNESAAYIDVHTWHNDWGNDSCDSHKHRELCKECATKFVGHYIMASHGTEELELSVEYISDRETADTGYIPISKEDVE